MVRSDELREMTEKIRSIRQTAVELKGISGGIQAVDRNADRILAACRVLEINVTDAASLER